MSHFSDLVAQRGTLLGLWQSLANPYTAEICAGAGFDWLCFDGEHAPNTIQTSLAQLQAVSGFPVHAMARPAAADPVLIKRYLDIGFPTLIMPMINHPDEAKDAVAATRFPPHGIRGVASGTSRASGFGAQTDYLVRQRERVGVIVQIESVSALANIDAIAAVEGVDGLFIGPLDLSASLGHLGDPFHPEVQTAIDRVLAAVRNAGKPAGIFALNPEDARRRLAQGFQFVAVGSDIDLLASGARRLLAGLSEKS